MSNGRLRGLSDTADEVRKMIEPTRPMSAGPVKPALHERLLVIIDGWTAEWRKALAADASLRPPKLIDLGDSHGA